MAKTMWLVILCVAVISAVAGSLWFRHKYAVFNFHVAVANAYIDVVTSELLANPKLVNTKGRHGSTALHWAALQGSIFANEMEFSEVYTNVLDFQKDLDYSSIIRLLLDKGADINAVGDGGWTPLHLAAAYGKVEVAGLLINRGAKADAKDNLGRTPLDRARENSRTDMVEYLESIQSKRDTRLDNKALAPADVQRTLAGKQSLRSAPLEMRNYADSKIAFSYPADMVLLHVNEKWGTYSLGRVDDLIFSIGLYPPDVLRNIRMGMTEVSENPLFKYSFLDGVVFGKNHGTGRSIECFDKNGKFFCKTYELILECGGNHTFVEMTSLSDPDFDINRYNELLASIEIK